MSGGPKYEYLWQNGTDFKVKLLRLIFTNFGDEISSKFRNIVVKTQVLYEDKLFDSAREYGKNSEGKIQFFQTM